MCWSVLAEELVDFLEILQDCRPTLEWCRDTTLKNKPANRTAAFKIWYLHYFELKQYDSGNSVFAEGSLQSCKIVLDFSHILFLLF